ncbi:MAG: c-type cytochrome, partial [Acidobacteriota bacterium]
LTQQQIAEDAPAELLTGHLLAWDPVQQKEVWRAQYDVPWSGGTLSTAGNLVFQGTPNGMLLAYRASDGELLWESYTGSGVIAAPITFSVGETQYIAIMSGWGGAFGVVGSRSARKAVESEGRILVYSLGAEGKEPERKERKPVELTAIPHDTSDTQVKEGRALFNRYCAVCHGYGATGGGVIADIRESAPRIFDNYDAIVLEGRRVERGMPKFDSVLDKDAVALIRSYVLHRRDAWRDELAAQAAAGGDD